MTTRAKKARGSGGIPGEVRAAIEVLRSWRDKGDVEEQREAREILQSELAVDAPSDDASLGEPDALSMALASARPDPTISAIVERIKSRTPEERRRRAEELIKLLDEWEADDSDDDEESWLAFKVALGRDRPSYRKLFDD
jgi:hypothetical protein